MLFYFVSNFKLQFLKFDGMSSRLVIVNLFIYFQMSKCDKTKKGTALKLDHESLKLAIVFTYRTSNKILYIQI